MTPLQIVEIVLASLLTAAILIQSKGVGLSATFGGEGNFYRTKRGFEKTLFNLTILLAIGFFTVATLMAFQII
ncbi:MAG: preprotein translocase subunit SecG [Parcubacteria group bacterium]|nr:preprotein translocase subunit SecG [Parcubacteria group bacterium]